MAIALVASAAAQSSDGDSVVTAAIDTTGANLLIGAVFNEDGTSELVDSKTNTWVPLTVRFEGTSLKRVQLYYVLTPNVGSGHTATASKLPGNTPFPGIWFAAFSLSTPGFFDAENGNTQTSGASIQPGSVSKDGGRSNALYVAVLNSSGIAATGSIDSSFVEDADLAEGGNSDAVRAAYKITLSASENPTYSLSGGVARTIAIAVFTDSGAAVGTRFLLTRF